MNPKEIFKKFNITKKGEYGEQMKLNVGSGKDYREGYINLEPHEKFKADMRMDIREAEFEENSLDEILAQDVIDHVTFVECKELMLKF